jgi:hypothetical protein
MYIADQGHFYFMNYSPTSLRVVDYFVNASAKTNTVRQRSFGDVDKGIYVMGKYVW